MRLSKELIKQIAEAIANNLESKGLARLSQPRHVVAAKVAEIITEDMMAEDRLNREVEKLLASYEGEISKGGMDYRKLFELTKQKLAKEKKMVI
jgi:hypothetical protein